MELNRQYYYRVDSKEDAEKFINDHDKSDKYHNKERLADTTYPIYFKLCNGSNDLTFTKDANRYERLGLSMATYVNPNRGLYCAYDYKSTTSWIAMDDLPTVSFDYTSIDYSTLADVLDKFKTTNKNNEEYCEMNNILERYEEKQLKRLEEEMKEQKKDIMMEDPLYVGLIDLEIFVESKDPKVKRCIDICFDDFEYNEDVKQKLADLNTDYKNKIRLVKDTLKDVKAVLSMADTFEQKQKILISYGILNDSGMLM